MLFWFAKLDCKNPNSDKCPLRGPIFLPYPNHPGVSASQPDWPTDGWTAFAVCPLCGFGSHYSKQDVRWGMSQDLGTWEQNAFLRLELKCDHNDCESPIEVFIYGPANWTTKDILRKISDGNSDPKCLHNHAPLRPLEATRAEVLTDLT
jgi:hypothetical protein